MTRTLATGLDVQVNAANMVEIVTADAEGEVIRLQFDGETARWIAGKLLNAAVESDMILSMVATRVRESIQ